MGKPALNSPCIDIALMSAVQLGLDTQPVDALLHPLEQAGASMSSLVGRTGLRLDYFIFRMVLTQFARLGLSRERAQAIIALVRSRGGSKESLAKAFQDVFRNTDLSVIARLADQVLLFNWLVEHGLRRSKALKEYAGETLACQVKRIYLGLSDRDNRLTPEIVSDFVRLGARPDSEPPAYHRERHPVTFYLAEISRPELLAAVRSALGPPPGWIRKSPRSTGERPKVIAVNKTKRNQVIAELNRINRDFDSGERIEGDAERARLDRVLRCMGPRFVPVLADPASVDEPWKMSCIGTEIFSSSDYPWPYTKRYPDAPILQLDLDEVSGATGQEMGSGYLQVWMPIGLYRRRSKPPPALKVRLIPRELIEQTGSLPSPPERYLQLAGHPDYSWWDSRIGGPKVITGWRKFGYAVPDPEIMDHEFTVSWGFLKQPVRSILKAAKDPTNAVELFAIPQPTRYFLRLSDDWKPLAMIYGPMDGARYGIYGYPAIDIIQLFYRQTKAGGFEYQAVSWRSFEGL